jgi:hypothetical protein
MRSSARSRRSGGGALAELVDDPGKAGFLGSMVFEALAQGLVEPSVLASMGRGLRERRLEDVSRFCDALEPGVKALPRGRLRTSWLNEVAKVREAVSTLR